MLADFGCRYAIVGHSERRALHHESDQLVADKAQAALAKGVTPIVCVGETLEHRESGQTEAVILNHCQGGISGLTAEQFSKILIAYEPVWAIGTGKTATPRQAEEVHFYIRKLITQKSGEAVGQGIRILYGGSVSPDNVKELMAEEDIDGALVGGASLKVDSFVKIARYKS